MGPTKNTPFETVEIVEPANPPKKPRVDAPEPKAEEEKAEIVQPAIPLPAPKQNGKPAPDDESMRLLGSIKLSFEELMQASAVPAAPATIGRSRCSSVGRSSGPSDHWLPPALQRRQLQRLQRP